jgi:Domain of unknown function (DUF4437)
MRKTFSLFAALTFVAAALALAADQKKTAATPGHKMYAPADIQWTDAPPVLPAGAKAAVLEGDPSKAGYFAMRLKFPGGYKIMPHWHPNFERITVISGALNLGLGDAFDESKGHALVVGTYATMQPKVHHFAWTTGDTEVQITTIGPWKLVYVNPKDDPSKTK